MRRIIIAVLIAGCIGGGLWYVATHRNSGKNTPSQPSNTNFFPTTDTLVPGTGTTNQGQIQRAAGPAQNTPFKQLSPRAVAGYAAFSAPASSGGAHLVRYVSRANGYVYEIKNGGAPLQISNIYIPNIYEAFFMDNFNTAVVRYLRDDERTIATYAIPIPQPNADGTRTQLQGTNLPDNITSFAPSPDRTLAARLVDTPDGAIAFTATSSNTARTEVIRSPFREWLLSWVGKTIYFQTKASARANGFLYRLEPNEHKLRRIVGDVSGLTTSVSPSGNYILYSESAGTGFSTKLLNVKTGAVTGISLRILPEKCAWLKNDDLICAGSSATPEAQYPDAWYKGLLSFSDRLYRISTATVTFTNLSSGTEGFDMTNLSADEDARKLYFTDKVSGLLWQFSY